MKVLLVEDDQDMAEVVSSALQEKGFAVDVASAGSEALGLSRVNEYDIAILDLHLPDMGGEAVCVEMRRASRLPILMLTVTPDVEVKVSLLNAGADDYLVKPFSFEELHARVRALLRRPHDITPEVLSVRDVKLDSARHIVQRGARIVRLTRKEFTLLEYLMRQRGKLVSKESLIEHAWQSSVNPFSDSVDTHLTNLRKKLGLPKVIHTVQGRGYRIA